MLNYTVLVGHRFALKLIQPGEALTSWGMPFGAATTAILPGDYICNAAMLRELKRRTLPFEPPSEPNFVDEVPAFAFDETNFSAAPPLPHYSEMRSFMGYRRSAARGVGTRNFIILLGTSSLTAGFVRALEVRLSARAAHSANIDGIVAVAHTEGGHRQQNNLDMLLRTLAGFVVHPNVGAVLAVDYGSEALNNVLLEDFMRQHDYPLDEVPHRFMSVSADFAADLESAASIVSGWLNVVNAVQREAVPLSDLKIALQCGGSDAFSGISGNPLAGWVAKEIIHYGGSANLAETDELVSAESYVLDKVRNLETAQRFLATIERFKTWAGWHGHAVTGNPSGGNLLRGLYNIYLKSLGAAAKKNPEVPLDYVIDYGERMGDPGFYFMDSPGNDLESIAGQVAGGCNMIFFVTGNGSITNFPFVPTIKIMTTSQRYQLLNHEMDVNAGEYLDGRPLDDLGGAMLDLTVEIASGQPSAGERAGHAQVQLWRNWSQTGTVPLASIRAEPKDGLPLPIHATIEVPEIAISLLQNGDRLASDRIGLIMPTSLCAGQIGLMVAQRLNRLKLGAEQGISRFVALAHTEGCGWSGTREYPETVLGYLRIPLVARALLLEHGCESTHNGYVRGVLVNAGLNPERFGWASIQLDGGIEAVQQIVVDWFSDQFVTMEPPQTVSAGLEALRIGLVTSGDIPDTVAQSLAALSRMIVSAGGSIILTQHDSLLASAAYRQEVLGAQTAEVTLNYAQHPAQAGLHVMETPSVHWSETLTGLGATGVELILAYSGERVLQGHPMIPVLYLSDNPRLEDADLILRGDSIDWPLQILASIASVLSRQYQPKLNALGNVDFQITRGLLGVSL